MLRPAIVWFRNDLRLSDNAALSAAAAAGPVIALYVLDDETPGPWRIGGASRWWLHRSLVALGKSVPLILRRGAADRAIAGLMQETNAASVHFMRGYEPWSAALEARVKTACAVAGATAHRYGGFLLHEPEAIRNGSGEPYKVYTPFARACFAAGEPKAPRPVPPLTPCALEIAGDRLDDWQLTPAKPDWARGFADCWQPGESGAQRRLAAFVDERLARYADHRDEPAAEATSGLSPHLHFGEVSPVQVWHAARAAAARASGAVDQGTEKFLKEVLWREFSWHLLCHWPSLPTEPFRPEFAAMPWRSDPVALAVWRAGKTGYPIVDAGLRELWRTGIMHNRVRMIVASFLIKHLLTDWRAGEGWFWDCLVDADLAANAASWQWVAGSGADAAPYFRIFNPVLQGEKFDPEGAYVRRFVPELARLPDAFIHQPWAAPASVLHAAGVELGRDYPHPVVDHSVARSRALAALKATKGLAE